jgi:hypothetical protein
MAPTHAPPISGASTDPVAPRRPDPRDVPRRTPLVARPVAAAATTTDAVDTAVEDTADDERTDRRP